MNNVAIFTKRGELLAFVPDDIATPMGMALAVEMCRMAKVPLHELIFMKQMTATEAVVLQQKISFMDGKLEQHAEKILHLTKREREVLRLVFASFQNKEIGETLNLSERRVKYHVSNLLSKFKCNTRTELALRVPQSLRNQLSVLVR
jgi:DNA-binding NarL/FixJ family response regulator